VSALEFGFVLPNGDSVTMGYGMKAIANVGSGKISALYDGNRRAARRRHFYCLGNKIQFFDCSACRIECSLSRLHGG
jgi:hypothetical protein